MRLILPVLAGIFVLAGCGSAGGSSADNNMTSEGTSSSGHVFVILMENKSYDKALRGHYTAWLASNYAVATNYHAVAHPSLPNYLALTSGSTWDITDDAYHSLPSGQDVGSELTSAGIPWRAYMEDMSKGCLDSNYPYALKHNPFAYYGGQCPSNVVPLSQLDADLSGNTPNFVWITPNLCHDEHNCSVNSGDQWLSEIVPKIMDSGAWKDDGVLFVTWDESRSYRVPDPIEYLLSWWLPTSRSIRQTPTMITIHYWPRFRTGWESSAWERPSMRNPSRISLSHKPWASPAVVPGHLYIL